MQSAADRLPAVSRVLALKGRSVYHVSRTHPAVFYLVDDAGGGLLINTPPYSTALRDELARLAPLRFAFYPSRLGACDTRAWRAAGIATIAYGVEARAIPGGVDIVLDRGYRFSRSVDFLPMSGRTEATCALRCKPYPAIIFFGPALTRGPSGWPEIAPQPDDFSYENRLLGAVGLRRLKYEFAFTDDFDPRKSRYGPGASKTIGAHLDALLSPGRV